MAGWEDAYARLAGFAREHAATDGARGIEMRPGSLSVPRELREEFYGLAGEVQQALAREVLGEQADEARAWAAACARSRDAVCASGHLRELRLASALEALVADADDALARPLFSAVLEALAAGAPADELRAQAQRELPPHAHALTRAAAEAAAYYGVVAALAPARFWVPFTPDMREVRCVRTEVVEASTQQSSPNLRLPEAVFETADGRTFAMKCEAAHELDFYGFANKRRRDNSAGGTTHDLLTHRVLLLWELANPQAVDFVADREKTLTTPTALTVDVLAPAEASTPAYVSAFVERIGSVRSRRPVQVLAWGGALAFPDGMTEDPTVPPICVRTLDADVARVAAEVAGTLRG